jgi:hypothetical protein
MRGVPVAKTKLNEALSSINDILKNRKIEEGDAFWDAINSALAKQGIKKNFNEGFRNGEFPLQARMINGMSDNSALKKALGTNNLYFAASEVILQEETVEGGKKIDIVAHDGAGKVFFFELKTDDNKKDSPLGQVASYILTYGKGGLKNKNFEDLMKNYPMYPIDSIKEYVGYAVIGYGNRVVHYAPVSTVWYINLAD